MSHCQEVSNYFGINTVKELIRNRFEKFKISYSAADNYLCLDLLWLYCILFSFSFLFLFLLPFLTVK